MKNLLNLGKALNKAEQKNVLGGGPGLTHFPGEADCLHFLKRGNPSPFLHPGRNSGSHS